MHVPGVQDLLQNNCNISVIGYTGIQLTERHKQPVRTHTLLPLVNIRPLPVHVSHQLIFWLCALNVGIFSYNRMLLLQMTREICRFLQLTYVMLFAITTSLCKI